MMERYYRLAGVELAIQMDENLMYEDERTLAPFAVESVSEPHCYSFEVVEELDPPRGNCVTTQPDFIVWQDGDTEIRYINLTRKVWEDAGIRAEHCGRNHRVQLKAGRYLSGVGVKTVLNSLEAEHLIARSSGFVFHSSYIVLNGRAILFTAPSGTGKSTQAELWRVLRGAEIINGDRSVVRILESDSSSVVADGIPFAGSSQICKNVTAPLAAIVYLGQAPQTTIRKLRGFEAFRSVWEGVSVNTWDETDVALVSETVQRVVQTVPVYRLDCTPDESAVIALERMMAENR